MVFKNINLIQIFVISRNLIKKNKNAVYTNVVLTFCSFNEQLVFHPPKKSLFFQHIENFVIHKVCKVIKLLDIFLGNFE